MATIKSINPANYEVLGEVESSSEGEVKMKVANANNAKKSWKEFGLSSRTKYLHKLFTELTKHKNELGELETREMGMPKQFRNLIDIDAALEYFEWYLENAEKYISPEVTYEDKKTKHTVYFEPTGVAAVIMPWNFPISNFVWGVIPNLIVGNTVVFKHSEECLLVGKRLEEIVKSVNLPEGVFSEVYGGGKIGDILIHQDIDLICFTGSTKTGKYLYEVAAEKLIKVVLELGGSAPGIVFEDADIDKVSDEVFFNRFVNCGQICDGLKRLIVHESRVDEVIQKLKTSLETKTVGNPEDEKTDLGPLVSKKQLELLESQVKDAMKDGAKTVTGGKSPKDLKGAYYMPTLLTNVTRNMRVWKEEVFGPVLPIISFKTEEEAVSLANDTEYGLGGYVFTEDKARAERVAQQIDTGMVAHNSSLYLLPCNPFGGTKNSGIGREHGKFGLRELCNLKVVALEK